MGRLIDADKSKADLEKAISKNKDMDCLDFLRVASVIDAQPTAYDPEKVVKQLEDCISDTEDSLTGKGARWAYKGAIEIVKGGGVTKEEKDGLFNNLDETIIQPEEPMNLAEMKAYVKGFEDARNAIFDTVDKFYRLNKTD